MDSGSPLCSARNDGGAGIRFLSAYFHARRPNPPSFPRKRESSTSAWIPGLRFTPPGMTGEAGGWYPVSVGAFPRPSNPPTVIPAKAGIHYLGMDSGPPFHSARNDGVRGGWYPVSVSALPRPSNLPPVIPAKAGIQYLGMDSGSLFHSAWNVGGAGWLVSGFCWCISPPVDTTPRHSRESGNPVPRHMDSGSPFHSARNDGGSGVAGIRSLSVHFHACRIYPPSFPRKRESSTSAWIPGLRSTPPGMTRIGQPCRTRPTPFASTSSGFPRSFSPADPFRRGRGWGR